MIQYVYVSMHVFIYSHSVFTHTVLFTKQFLPWLCAMFSDILYIFFTEKTHDWAAQFGNRMLDCVLYRTLVHSVPRGPSASTTLTCSYPSWLCLLRLPWHSLAFQKSRHFHMLYVSWDREVVTLPSFAGVTISPQIVSTEDLNNTLSSYLTPRDTQSDWQRTGTK